MSVVAATHAEGLAARRALRSARIRAIAFVAIGLASFWVATGALETTAWFKFWIDKQGGASADMKTTVGILWIVAGGIAVVLGVLQFVRGASFGWRRWLFVLLVPFVGAIMAQLLDGKPANLTGVFDGTLELAAPLTLGALAGILSERSGLLNIAIEGKMLTGACVAAITASFALNVTGEPLIGVFIGVSSAMLAGGLLGFLLAWLGIRHKVDQIIAGTVINIGALGITNFLFLRILGRDVTLNTPPTIEPVRLPVLAEIPVLGPILFTSKPYVYVAIALVIMFTYLIYRTRWGLRLRASGEKPAAAGTVGINVLAIRYRSLILAGLLAGLAGSYFSLSAAGSFQMDMAAGRGYVALAAVIFGAWHPIGAFGAALVFGFADASRALLGILGVDVPPQFLNMVPYVITIVVVAGVVGRVRGPAAAGQPYEQG